MPIKTVLKRFLPILLAIGLLVYTLRGMPLTSLTEQIRRAAPGWVALAALIVSAQTVLRAIRWQLLLHSLNYPVRVGRALTATMAGNVSGLILPGSGELIRCTILNRSDGVPIPQSIGTVVAERFIDLIATALVIGLTLLLQTNRLLGYVREHVTLPGLIRQATGGQLLLLSVGGVLFLLAGTWLVWWGWQRLPERYQFREIITGLRKGLASAWRVRNVPLYLLINVLIHGLSILVLWALFRALPITETLPVAAALTVVAVSSVGSLTIPTQANLGSYHFLASRTLLAYQLPLVDGVVWATFSHAVFTLTSILLSLVGFIFALRWLNRGRLPWSASHEQKVPN